MKTRTALLLAVFVVVCWVAQMGAAEQWVEIKSPHFTVVSSAGERAARSLVWQLEQVRSAMASLWAWARVDLNKPLIVLATGNEGGMRAPAPQYWEERGSVHPASVWVSGPDRHYLAIRTDLRAADTERINPHINAYFSYIGLIMGQSLDPDLPLMVQPRSGRCAQQHAGAGRPRARWRAHSVEPAAPPRACEDALARFLTLTRRSPEFTQAGQMETFDAQAWAFVHFLMFGEAGKRLQALDRFARIVSEGGDAQAAFAETLGPVEALVGPFARYFERNIFSMMKVKLDVSVEPERLPSRKLTTAESAAVRASYHATMRRPAEARKLIAEANGGLKAEG